MAVVGVEMLLHHVMAGVALSDVGWPSWVLIIWNNEYYSYRAAAALPRAARAGNGFCPHLVGHLSGDQRSALREFRRTISIHLCYCSPYDLNDLSLAILQEAKDKKWWSREKAWCAKNTSVQFCVQCVRRRWYLKQLLKPEFILHLYIKAINRESLHVHQNFLGAVFRYLSLILTQAGCPWWRPCKPSY